MIAAFLRGLFDADGCAVHNTEKGSYVGLGSISTELLRGVQRLLSTFGVSSRIYNTKSAGSKSFTYERKDGSTVVYSSKASFDLRITGRSMRRYAAEIGFSLSRKSALLSEAIADHEIYDVDTSIRLVDRIDEGIELTYNLSEPRTGAVHAYLQQIPVRRNAGCLLKDSGQMKRAQMCRRCNVRQAQLPGVVVMNETYGLGHRPRLC